MPNNLTLFMLNQDISSLDYSVAFEEFTCSTTILMEDTLIPHVNTGQVR